MERRSEIDPSREPCVQLRHFLRHGSDLLSVLFDFSLDFSVLFREVLQLFLPTRVQFRAAEQSDRSPPNGQGNSQNSISLCLF